MLYCTYSLWAMVFNNIIKLIYFTKKIIIILIYYIIYILAITYKLTENAHNKIEEFDMGPTRTIITST